MNVRILTKSVTIPEVGVNTAYTRRIAHSVRDQRAAIANRLLPALVETIDQEPVKELARDTGIAPDTLKERKQGRSLLDGPGLFAVAMARPNSPLARAMVAMLRGQAGMGDAEIEARAIAEVLRQIRGGT